MPWSALPPHLDTPEEWKGTDWDNKYQKWLLKFKGWFAYGPRAKEWWAKWRRRPNILFAIRGKGCWRWESFDGNYTIHDYEGPVLKDKSLLNGYWLTCIQYYSRWHFAIQWPFFISFHFYFKAKDVPPVYNPVSRPQVDNKLVFFRFGARRDADEVYWFPSLFIGGAWN